MLTVLRSPIKFPLVNFKELALSFADNHHHCQNKLHPHHHHHFYLDRVGARCAYRPDQDLFLCRAWCCWTGFDLANTSCTFLRKYWRSHLVSGGTSLRRLRCLWWWRSWWSCSGLAIRPGVVDCHLWSGGHGPWIRMLELVLGLSIVIFDHLPLVS